MTRISHTRSYSLNKSELKKLKELKTHFETLGEESWTASRVIRRAINELYKQQITERPRCVNENSGT